MLPAALALIFAQIAPAAPTPVPAPLVAPSLVPVRTPRPPRIDGDLSDPVWALAAATTAFTQKFPVERAAPSERTTLRVLYDDDAIYIAFDVEQRTVPVVARMARRDREIESDSVSIDIDSRALGKTAFEFTVTAAGVLLDGIRSNDMQDGDRYSSGWDETWDARTRIRSGGWSAELRIPLRVLRFASSSVQTWGFQARRYTSMRQETDEWSHVPRNVASEVSLYGHLEDIRVRPRADLELRPFVLGRLRRFDRTDVTLESGVKLGASAGLDLRWHLTPDLTLDGTMNPDFTQVEGDELFLNLSNFESFFPEKRPFFVEGAEIFESPAPLFFARSFQLLYTRRIGRRPGPPALRPSPAFDDRLVALPEPSTILGATKLVGRLAHGWSVGAMSALTTANSVEVQEPGGVRRDRLVDPTTSYQVVRVKHDFEGGKAHVGFLGTGVVRAEKAGEYPTYAPGGGSPLRAICPGGEELAPGSRCTHDAYVGSIDGLWRSADGEILLSGQAIGSVIKHGPPRTLRDGTVIADGDAGYGAQLIATREGGSGLAWNAQYQHASRKLDFNDLGYMERQNQHFYYGNFEYRTFEPLGPTLETKTWIEVAGRYDLDLVKVSRRWLTDTYVRYKNFWSSYLEINFEEPKFDDREIGNGLHFERPGRPGIVLQADTDKRKDVFFGASVFAQKIPDGENIEARLRALVRAHPQLELELTPSVSHTSGETRFATFGATNREMIFGDLSASSFATTARLNFTITPRLALQTFGQVFLASGHYDAFRSFVSAADETSGKIRLKNLAPTAAPATNPDFLDVSLNVNVVLRWEYSLGSVVYLVFNRSQTPANPLVLDQPAALSLGPLGRAPAVDTVLLKWQLFLNL
ncbi:MAG TPA: DUF5916 domain-containing protein [Labilithrix sp.]|nr:DUF5916 domain-containing protein [Labilithrix sp.]